MWKIELFSSIIGSSFFSIWINAKMTHFSFTIYQSPIFNFNRETTSTEDMKKELEDEE